MKSELVAKAEGYIQKQKAVLPIFAKKILGYLHLGICGLIALAMPFVVATAVWKGVQDDLVVLFVFFLSVDLLARAPISIVELIPLFTRMVFGAVIFCLVWFLGFHILQAFALPFMVNAVALVAVLGIPSGVYHVYAALVYPLPDLQAENIQGGGVGSENYAAERVEELFRREAEEKAKELARREKERSAASQQAP